MTTQRELSVAEIQLMRIKDTLKQAPQDKLHKVRSRFDGLLNAYKDDEEAIAMLRFLMAEYSLTQQVQMEKEYGSTGRNSVNVH
jgi:antitoxin component HigA of HigAB toxin-antitoxin module